MVIAARASRFARFVWTHVNDDLRACWTAARGHTLAVGLHAYRLHPPGGMRRVHLRVEEDGSGVLLVDVNHAIHLNDTATLLAKAALDGLPQADALALVRQRFRGLPRDKAAADARSIYSLVEHLRTMADSCPTCGLGDVRQSPLFSTPVAAPYKADLALTYGCNNACRHCYNEARTASNSPASSSSASRGVYPLGLNRENTPDFQEKDAPARCEMMRGDKPPGSLIETHGSLIETPGSLDLCQWRTVLAKLAQIGIPHVIFTGGEPTLVAWLFEIIREAETLGLVSGMNTNGRKLADPSYTAKLKQAGLDHVQITLESPRREVHNAMTAADSFDETVRGIQNAIAAGLHTITNTTLTKENVAHAIEIVDYLHGLGLKTFAMNGMIHSGRGRDNTDALQAEELYPVLRAVRDRAARLDMRFLWYTPTRYCRLSPLELELGPRRCNAGEYSMCIEPNGDVLPCQSYYVRAGNILRDPWPAIWESELFRGFRDRGKNPQASGLPVECHDCPDLAVCGGGCRLEREGE